MSLGSELFLKYAKAAATEWRKIQETQEPNPTTPELREALDKMMENAPE